MTKNKNVIGIKKADLENLKSMIKEKNALIETLKEQFDFNQKTLIDDVKVLSEALGETREKLESKNKELDVLHEKLKCLENKDKPYHIKATLDTYTDRIESLENSNKSYSEDLAILETKNDNLIKINEALSEELNKANDEINGFMIAIEKYQEKLENKSQEMQNEEKKLKEIRSIMSKQIDDLEHELKISKKAYMDVIIGMVNTFGKA